MKPTPLHANCRAVPFAALLGALLAAALPPPARAQDSGPADLPNPAPTHGHSMLGDVFNEGPRQRAVLMKGMGNVQFPVTARSPLAQKFFNQGVAQLHGFWYFEAERSFRQVAALDPGCVMAYWGMAMANVNNQARARKFIEKAVEKEKASTASSASSASSTSSTSRITARERMYLDALSAYYQPGAIGKERKREYVRALERIVKACPEDLEAKAFLCLQVWEDEGAIPIFSRAGVDAMMKQVLAKNPMHPLHHYRIHLWNGRKDSTALDSAALCGQSEPGIAHMWHMPGHTYSALQRYADAAWQQEASARVDHAHMMRYWVLPDQIQNYAHNNQWCIEDLDYIGRVHDAVDLARNMLELPRHPQYNTVDGRGSAREGRRRLFQVTMDYELWGDLIALADTVYLEPTDSPEQQLKRTWALGVAHFSLGDTGGGRQQLAALDSIVRAEEEARRAPGPGETLPNAKLTDLVLKQAQQYAGELRGYDALAGGRRTEAADLFEKAEYLTKERRARLLAQCGRLERAEAVAREAAQSQPNQIVPQATLVEVLHLCGKRDAALAEFKKLQAMSGSIAYGDMQTPPFKRLSSIAPEYGLQNDWRVASVPAKDVGKRPSLDSLGPFRWTPPAAPDFTLPDSEGRPVSLHSYQKRGRPVLVLFYLGSRCLQCMEQLNAFAPAAKDFQAAGIDVVAVGSDTVRGLKDTLAESKEKGGFPFPVLSDYGLKAFKAFRAYDDFEKMPLHGAFLVDAKGRVRWMDISYQPFKDTAFLLAESRRLLAQDQVPALPPGQKEARARE